MTAIGLVAFGVFFLGFAAHASESSDAHSRKNPNLTSRTFQPPVAQQKESVFKDRREFISKVSEMTESALSAEEKLMNSITDRMAKDPDPKTRQRIADGKLRSEKERQSAWEEYQKLLSTNPQTQKAQLSNLLKLRLTKITKKEVEDLFGVATTTDNSKNTVTYGLYTGGKMIYLSMAYRPPIAIVSFKFSADDKLVEIFSDMGRGKYIVY
ncbi:hypothetical protein BH10BDE1_BH10BDE1_33480 [soil metagenome]